MKSRKFNLVKKTQFKVCLDFFANLFFTYCVIIGLALILFSSVTIECQVVGSSMRPTLNEYSDIENKKDVVYVNTCDKTVTYGDIVVCDTAKDAIIKRVVGLPGDIIDIVLSNGEYKLELNGKIIEEDYINVSSDIRVPAISRNGMDHTHSMFQLLISEKPELFNNDAKLIVPENTIFVLGDNRAVSVDSSTLGPIHIDNLQGRVELTLFSGESEFAFYYDYLVRGKFFTTLVNMF